MNINLQSDLTNEIKEKVKEGTKPSDLKKSSPANGKKNSTVSAIVNFRVENIEGAIKNLDKDLAIFKDNVSQKLEKIEKQTQISLWEKTRDIILLIGVIVVTVTSCYCAYKLKTLNIV